jgi:hypothetical protein
MFEDQVELAGEEAAQLQAAHGNVSLSAKMIVAG